MNLVARTKRRLRRGMVRFLIWLIRNFAISATELGFKFKQEQRKLEVFGWGGGKPLVLGNNVVTRNFHGRPVSLFIDRYRNSSTVLQTNLMVEDLIDRYFLQLEIAGLAQAITGSEGLAIADSVLIFPPPELGQEGTAYYLRRNFPRLIEIGERFMDLPERIRQQYQ